MRLEIYGNNYVVREGNEKITLFIGGDPYAHITGRVLFLKYSTESTSLAGTNAATLIQFAGDYKNFYGTTIVNRDVLDSLSIAV